MPFNQCVFYLFHVPRMKEKGDGKNTEREENQQRHNETFAVCSSQVNWHFERP